MLTDATVCLSVIDSAVRSSAKNTVCPTGTAGATLVSN